MNYSSSTNQITAMRFTPFGCTTNLPTSHLQRALPEVTCKLKVSCRKISMELHTSIKVLKGTLKCTCNRFSFISLQGRCNTMTYHIWSRLILHEKTFLKRDFCGKNFCGFAITQFVMPTNVPSFSGWVVEWDKRVRWWATYRAMYTVKSIIRGYQPVCYCIYAFSLGAKWSYISCLEVSTGFFTLCSTIYYLFYLLVGSCDAGNRYIALILIEDPLACLK